MHKDDSNNNLITIKDFFRENNPGLYLHIYKEKNIDYFHSHEFHEIIVVLKGTGMHITEETSFPIYSGDVFGVEPGLRHDFHNVKNLEVANFLYLPEKLNLPLWDLESTDGFHAFFKASPRLLSGFRFANHLSLEGELWQQTKEIIMEINHYQKSEEAGYQYNMIVAFMRFIGIICQSYSLKKDKHSMEIMEISRALRYLERNYKETITLKDIAKVTGKSISLLNRLFNTTLGKSPIDYLISIRLEKAMKMLRCKDHQISEIALESGFKDSNYFTRVFTEKTGINPREYRKRFTH